MNYKRAATVGYILVIFYSLNVHISSHIALAQQHNILNTWHASFTYLLSSFLQDLTPLAPVKDTIMEIKSDLGLGPSLIDPFEQTEDEFACNFTRDPFELSD
jgi:hypothetical protein